MMCFLKKEKKLILFYTHYKGLHVSKTCRNSKCWRWILECSDLENTFNLENCSIHLSISSALAISTGELYIDWYRNLYGAQQNVE